jgi:hypothetical protein
MGGFTAVTTTVLHWCVLGVWEEESLSFSSRVASRPKDNEVPDLQPIP